MSRYEALVALAAIIFGTGSFVGVTWAIAYAWAKSRRPSALGDAGVARLEQRMERIEQAIDAVAVEVERVSEGQRFTTRLLSERASEKAGT
jgi:hypothetical protein